MVHLYSLLAIDKVISILLFLSLFSLISLDFALHRDPNITLQLTPKCDHNNTSMEEVLHELVSISLVDEALYSSPFGNIIYIVLVSILFSLLPFEISQHPCLLEILHLHLVIVPVLHQ